MVNLVLSAIINISTLNIAGHDQPNGIDIKPEIIEKIDHTVLIQDQVLTDINGNTEGFIPSSIHGKKISGVNIISNQESNIDKIWVPLGRKTTISENRSAQSVAVISISSNKNLVLISSYTNWSINKIERKNEYLKLFKLARSYSSKGYDVIIGGDFNTSGANDRKNLTLIAQRLYFSLTGYNTSAEEFSQLQKIAYDHGFILKAPTGFLNLPKPSMDFGNLKPPSYTKCRDPEYDCLKFFALKSASSMFVLDGIGSNINKFDVEHLTNGLSDHKGVRTKIKSGNTEIEKLSDFQVNPFNPFHLTLNISIALFLLSKIFKKASHDFKGFLSIINM